MLIHVSDEITIYSIKNAYKRFLVIVRSIPLGTKWQQLQLEQPWNKFINNCNLLLKNKYILKCIGKQLGDFYAEKVNTTALLRNFKISIQRIYKVLCLVSRTGNRKRLFFC